MPVEKSELSVGARVGYFTSNLFLRGLIGAAGLVPYRWRIPAMGWLMGHLIAPLAGFHKRIRDNLALTCPDLPEAEVQRLCRAVPDNAGRTLFEFYAGQPFLDRGAAAPITGPGLAAFEAARAEGRPVILVTGHFGNYCAARLALKERGHEMGALYRRMANPYFNEHYVKAMASIGRPMFEQGRRGMMEMVRHLRGGGIIAILSDLHAHGGSELTFFGQPAVTSLTTAEMALKYNAALIPIYAIRQPDGLNFAVTMQAEIEHTDARSMTQKINDDLEALVRENMEQWFWIHRRWKPWVGGEIAETDA